MPYQPNTTVCMTDSGYSHICADSCFYTLGVDGTVMSSEYPEGGILTVPGCMPKIPYRDEKPCTVRFAADMAPCCGSASGGSGGTGTEDCETCNEQVNQALTDAFSGGE